jgi:uroporphyrinogen-III decarboxylase
MVKALLQGAAPSRPLLMPIIFSLGARLQSVPVQHFLANPTKIVNALRQIRSVLKVDGLACYCDPFMEAVALGCKREWHADGSCTITPSSRSADGLRQRLADGLPGAGHIPVACDVLRRLRAMLKDEPALMVRVAGPLSLAAILSGARIENPTSPQYRDLVEFAAEVTASVSKSFAEAGADTILLSEDSLPEMSPETRDWYESLLTPIANVIRFYEALPVVYWSTTSAENLAPLLKLSGNCALCPLLSSDMLIRISAFHLKQNLIGASLPAGVFCGDLESLQMFPGNLPNLGLLTSAQDLPATADVKQITLGLDAIRARFTPQRAIHETLAHPP